MENTQCSLQASPIIKDIINLHNENRYDKCLSFLEEALKEFSKTKEYENVSICLSLIGLNTYYKNKEKYLKAFNSINDGKYLADSTNNVTAKLINEFVTAKIELKEQHNKEALLYFQNAKKLANKEDIYNLKSEIENQIKKISTPNTTKKRDPLVALLKIGQAVAAETDINILLKVIAEETKAAIQADRCSVFLYDKKNEELWSKVALGIESQEIRFTVHKGLAGHVVQTGETINIKDAYSDGRFNPEIDRQTGYHTKTILCMPIKNLNQEIIGAFQVLNKFEGEFNEEDEEFLIAIGSNAGIALENAQLFHKQQEMLKEQKQVFESFIDTLATSIDARDKITAGHSSRVRLYSGLIARAMNLDEKMINIVETAATLHDIGKIGIRDSVLQKDGKLTDEEYRHIQEHAEITHNILEKIHISEDFKLVTEIASTHHEK
ncbi:MAG: GAF domain-containing protein, partial [bacterium]|nr:GAF domain-containing protein [bacterium]